MGQLSRPGGQQPVTTWGAAVAAPVRPGRRHRTYGPAANGGTTASLAPPESWLLAVTWPPWAWAMAFRRSEPQRVVEQVVDRPADQHWIEIGAQPARHVTPAAAPRRPASVAALASRSARSVGPVLTARRSSSLVASSSRLSVSRLSLAASLLALVTTAASSSRLRPARLSTGSSAECPRRGQRPASAGRTRPA